MGAWCLRSGTGLRPLAPAPFADGPIEILRRSKRGNISIVHRFEGLHEGTGAQRVRAGRGRTEAGVAELYEEAACEMADI